MSGNQTSRRSMGPPIASATQSVASGSQITAQVSGPTEDVACQINGPTGGGMKVTRVRMLVGDRGLEPLTFCV